MLTIQINLNGDWHDAATLRLVDGEHQQDCAVGYTVDHALEWESHTGLAAVSVRHPVALLHEYQQRDWLPFLEDIIPAGAARRYWLGQLNLANADVYQQRLQLLQQATIAPVGNLRIKESVPQQDQDRHFSDIRFSVDEVVERDSSFLEYAQQKGAASGGATGAGGEAPKLLLRCSPEEEIWIDALQDDPNNLDQHYLVKFPRGKSDDDRDILRAEYHYYHELTAMGCNTIATEGMRLIEGSRMPSLWLPRFDVVHQQGELRRLGLESIFSVMGVNEGHLNHFEVIDAVSKQLLLAERDGDSVQRFVIEWVKRDLLNIAFGNADNHGRNSSLIKNLDGGIELAPIYDFAPMKADPEGIARTIQWGAPFERGGQFDWQAIAERLVDFVPPQQLLAELSATAKQLLGLKSRLAQRGVPKRILEMPTMGFDYLDQKLEQQWQLI